MDEGSYGITVSTPLAPDEAEQSIRKALADEGFGILTEIDVAATLKAKLGIDREPYKILGACNPQLANRALEVEESIGLLLPCNVVVYAGEEHTTVAALEPLTMTQLVADPAIEPVAREARERLERALRRVEQLEN
ncbi:MAG: DUF302 domain-containing protein [Gemmatimonadales bacterium]|nr:DUF302 domain-containing protein [Gemmatimonadales bacterium]